VKNLPILNAKTPVPTKSKEDIQKDLDKFLKEKKHWNDYKIEGILPCVIPYYFCIIKAVKGIIPTENGTKAEKDIKFETIKLEINGENGEVSENFYKILDKEPLVFVNKVEDIYKVINPIIEKDKAKEIALYYAKSKKPDYMVSCAGVNMIYWPIWKFWIKLKSGKKGKEEKHLLLYDCISGKFLNEKDIPERDVPWLEVFFGLTDKLKNPNSWFELGKNAHKSFFKSEKKEKQMELILILLIILLIIVLLF